MKPANGAKRVNGKTSTTSRQPPKNQSKSIEKKAEGKSAAEANAKGGQKRTTAAALQKQTITSTAAARKYNMKSKESTTVSQALGKLKIREMGSPRGSIFNDISSIIGDQQLQVEDHIFDELLFRPMTNDDYHHSIPISVQILHDIVDHVIQEDEKKNVKARARAIRLAVQQAWLSSISFQFFNDKRTCESMTEQMRIDILDAETEPKPCPPDVSMSHQTKIRIRTKPLELTKNETKWSIPRSLLKKKSLRLQMSAKKPFNNRKDSSDTSMGGQEKMNLEQTRRNRASHFISQKHMTVMDFNSVPDLSKYDSRRSGDGGSDVHNASFSYRESRNQKSFGKRNKTQQSPEQRPEPVNLRDLSGYVSTNSGELSHSDEEWSEKAHKKKKTIRAKNRMIEQENKMLKLIPTNTDKRKAQGASLLKDSEMGQTQKKTAAQMQASLAAHDSRLKAQQVKFNSNVPTIVEEEAPGYPISLPQNKKHKRFVVKKPAGVTLKPDESSQRVYEQSGMEAEKPAARTLQTHFAPEYSNNNLSKNMSKMSQQVVQQILDSKLNYSTQQIVADASKARIDELEESHNQSMNEKQKPSVVPQLMKDALLKKLLTIDKQSNRGKLMPSYLSTTMRTQKLPSMVGQLCPYQIKQLAQKPHFKIDANTYNVTARSPNSKHIGQDPQMSLNNSTSRINVMQRGIKSHSTTDLFDHLLTEVNGKGGNTLDSRLSFNTKASADGLKRNQTYMDDDKNMFPPVRNDRVFQSILNQDSKKKGKHRVTVQDTDEDDEIDPTNERTIDDHRNYLSIVQQRNEESENVSPLTKAKSRKHQNKVVILPPLDTKHLSKSQAKLPPGPATHDRVIVKKSSSVPQLLASGTPQSKAGAQPLVNDKLMQSCFSSFGTTPKNLAKAGGSSVNLLGRMESHNDIKKPLYNSTTNYTSMQGGLSGGGGSQVFSIGRNIAKIENPLSMQTIPKIKTSRISLLQNNKGLSGGGFTNKVQIQNLELSKKLISDDTTQKVASQTVRQHRLMNVGAAKSTQGIYASSSNIILDQADVKQSYSRQQESNNN